MQNQIFISGQGYLPIEDLIQAGRSMSCLGLINGKMGITIALFRYAHLSGELAYEEVASELLDEVCERLDYSMPVSFGDGLCGIGWGIEYLIRQKYIEGDADLILEEIDRVVIAMIHLRRITKIDLEEGLCGIGKYLIGRIHWGNGVKDTYCSAKLKEYLIYWVDWLDELLLYKEEGIKDVLDLLSELYDLGFYKVKVRSILKRLISEPQGVNWMINKNICF